MSPDYRRGAHGMGTDAHPEDGGSDYIGPASWRAGMTLDREPFEPSEPRRQFYARRQPCPVCTRTTIGYTNDPNGTPVYVHTADPMTGCPRICRT
jgi:hypothetical protein